MISPPSVDARGRRDASQGAHGLALDCDSFFALCSLLAAAVRVHLDRARVTVFARVICYGFLCARKNMHALGDLESQKRKDKKRNRVTPIMEAGILVLNRKVRQEKT